MERLPKLLLFERNELVLFLPSVRGDERNYRLNAQTLHLSVFNYLSNIFAAFDSSLKLTREKERYRVSSKSLNENVLSNFLGFLASLDLASHKSAS